MSARRPPVALPSLRQASRGRSCIRCGERDGTVVRAHYTGLGQGRLGKGKGIKPHDFASADLCRRCHDEFDTYHKPNTWERSWEFLMLCMETLERDFRDGVLVEGIDPSDPDGQSPV
jgi:hypothetical protein